MKTNMIASSAIALAAASPRTRARGTHLPLQPRGFVLPYIGHFVAGLPVIGAFQVIAWLQLFTIPLLAASFNTFFEGTPATGRWRS